ncbi:MAG: anti-sigma factor family protein [Acidobacteriaceae bacterium]
MANQHPFENKPVDGIRCEEWEAWLAESLDGELPEAAITAFEAHGHSCPSCSELLSHAPQGREWMQFLHEEPHVPPALVGKILDKTTGPGGVGVLAGAVPAAAGPAVWPLSMRRSFQETRLLMTLAMAFFSITLTLNLIGFRPGNVKLQDLSVSSLENAAVRGFYGTKQKVVYTYENLRFLYEMDSQLRAIQKRALPQKAVKKVSGGGAKLEEPPALTGSERAVKRMVEQPSGETARADEGKAVVKEPDQGNGEVQKAERSRA